MKEHASSRLDKVIHQKNRLGLMSILMVADESDFNHLKKRLDLTDGNLSTHLNILEKEGYITIQKSFVGKKPRTTCRITKKGRKAFIDHMNALEEIIHDIPTS